VSRMRSFLILTAVICMLATSWAAAQGGGGLPFTIQVRQGDVISDVGAGATIPIAAGAIGLPATASITVTYTGEEATNITGIDLTGSLDFTVSGPAPPFALDRGDSFAVTVQYLPSASDLAQGLLTFTYTVGEASPTFSLNLEGTAPEFGFVFTPQGGNAAQVAPGATLSFPDTAVDATSTATMVITNRGTATGVINAVTTSGSAYAVTGLPLMPTEVEPGQSLTFTLRFTPGQINAVTGGLAIDLVDGPASFVLQGTGTGAQFTYEIIRDETATPVAPNQTITMSDTLIGETSSVVMRVRNTGNADGQITAISATGAAFSVSDVPFLPATVAPGATVLFTLNFSPDQAGQLIGRLRVGADEFDLLGNGLGSLLEYSVTIAGNTTSVANKGTVIFPPAPVGGNSSAVFTIKNAGTSPAVINSISLSKTGTDFSLAGVPGLPLTLPPDASASLTVSFAPSVEGGAVNTLVVDAATFTLSAMGNPAPALPAYQFAGASGVQAPRTQPAIGLTLAAPYELPLTGALKLEFASEAFSNDPSVQFSTGGRTVAFTIPANTTQAVFPNNSTQIKIQTGTVAGTITITPSFATEGGADLTPGSVETLTMSVLEDAPVVMSVAIGQRTPTSLQLEVTGFATNRSVTGMTLQFSPAAGESVSTTSLTLDVDAAFSAWYQSSQSEQYGSQFKATVPLRFSGDVGQASNLVNTIQSISVTLANAKGNSAAVSVAVAE